MTTQTTTVFARSNDAGSYSILDIDSGMPVTQLDTDVYPVGSQLGCRYEHAEGIRLTHADVAAAGIEFENAADAATTPTAPGEEEDDAEQFPRVEEDGEVLDDEAILPGSFTYFDGDGREFAYRYLGQEEYEVRRWMPENQVWWVHQSERYDDDVTVEGFLMMQNY